MSNVDNIVKTTLKNLITENNGFICTLDVLVIFLF